MGIAIEKEELKEIIREVIREELLNLAISLTPHVSDEEMKDVEKRIGEEGFKEGEFVDGSEWLGRYTSEKTHLSSCLSRTGIPRKGSKGL